MKDKKCIRVLTTLVGRGVGGRGRGKYGGLVGREPIPLGLAVGSFGSGSGSGVGGSVGEVVGDLLGVFVGKS